MLPNYYDSLYNSTTSVQKGLDCYITAELPAKEINHTKVFPIGDGTVFEDKYTNEPLLKGQQYIVYERAMTYYEKVAGAYVWKQFIVIFGQLIEYVL